MGCLLPLLVAACDAALTITGLGDPQIAQEGNKFRLCGQIQVDGRVGKGRVIIGGSYWDKSITSVFPWSLATVYTSGTAPFPSVPFTFDLQEEPRHAKLDVEFCEQGSFPSSTTSSTWIRFVKEEGKPLQAVWTNPREIDMLMREENTKNKEKMREMEEATKKTEAFSLLVHASRKKIEEVEETRKKEEEEREKSERKEREVREGREKEKREKENEACDTKTLWGHIGEHKGRALLCVVAIVAVVAGIVLGRRASARKPDADGRESGHGLSEGDGAGMNKR
jgi:hypothetical protein